MKKTLAPLYHGTLKEHVEIIVNNFELNNNNPFIIPSNNHADWLGRGVYFWEDSYENGKWWANIKSKGKEIGVICASVEVDFNDFLNMDLRKSQEDFQCFIRSMNEQLKAHKKAVDLDSNKIIEDFSGCTSYKRGEYAKLIAVFAEIEGYKVIKKTFEQKKILPDGTIDRGRTGHVDIRFPELSPYYTNTQICVRDQSVIKNLECVSV
ncbi:hypothetical protein G9403_02275 [Weissella paramesenteroides]|uniref:DUF3990 domain-containing protein n=1 Tax=Weissella paramesenteroides TaxID=1249 RepID=A0ABD4XH18_WEIPA|nr:hypothetical protein [Weissella paramesenteroides]MDF8368322.1 hypothetical protein [Weissella paramesenteroides]MDF8370489.1 hypothetical protein [Weissella paramesenteroides]